MVQRTGEKKLQYHMMPESCLRELTRVFMMGAEKHGELSYQMGISNSDLYDACLRHLEKIRSGESIDPESGIHHAFHAAWNAMMIGYFYHECGE